MDQEVKQRNRRRKRAQRMQAQRDIKPEQRDGDSADEEIIREKPQRPPVRRKKSKDPLVEEDIIDGFSILGFKSYDDLELVLKISTKENIKRLVEIERPKLEPKQHITHHISAHNNHALTLTHDPATSDDSGRASERLTGSSVPPRDADSSRDRLSDASSRCSSGKGYICDSEGEDDKGSDASSVIFASTPTSRKHEFPGALPPSLPLSNGANGSPVPAPTPPNLPAPSPAPAQLPPLHPPAAISSATVPFATPTAVTTATVLHKATPDSIPCIAAATPIATSVPPSASIPTATIPQQQAAAPLAAVHPSLEASSIGAMPGSIARTESPAVGTSANAAVAPTSGGHQQPYLPPQYHPPPHHHHHHMSPMHHHHIAAAPATSTPTAQPAPLYTPYSTTAHQPYISTPTSTMAAPPTPSTVTTMTATPAAATAVPPASPRLHSPAREREQYSSTVTNQNRTSSTVASQLNHPPPSSTAVSSSLVHRKTPTSAGPPWGPTVPTSIATQSTAPVPRPTPPPLHATFPAPMFAPPQIPAAPAVSTASPHTTATSVASNPFSAENLFQTNQADMLRRELDNRFLASQDRTLGVAPPPYLRTEMHQHQHHHTHVHQHTTSLLPPTAGSSLFPSPLTISSRDKFARHAGSSFKDIPKLGSVDSPFYRQNLAIPNYPGYTPPGLLHPGLTAGPTPFVPPTHLPTFQPKSLPVDPTKPKPMKTGRWNAMHVRVAWEIYHHQQKSGEAKGSIAAKTADLLRPPTHLFSPNVHSTSRPHELPFPPSLSRPTGFEQPSHPGSLFAPTSHLTKSPFSGGASTLSPFTRYGSATAGYPGASPFGVSPFSAARDMTLGGPLHDPWRSLQRSVHQAFPPPPSVNPLPPTLPGLGVGPPPAPWTIKPDPIMEQREREAREREERERERLRREREERERREREEKQRRLEQERERERREKERREHERREMERERERERERLLHQQRLAEAAAKSMPQSNPHRDRSPMHNGQPPDSIQMSGMPPHSLANDVRIKEEPRIKEEDTVRYHPYLRPHPAPLQHPPSMLDRRMMPPHPGLYHQPHQSAHWPPPSAHDPFYHQRYDPLRYNPLMDAAMRAEEERAKLFGAYHPSQIRTKDPASLMHLRPGPGPPPPPTAHSLKLQSSTTIGELPHKKEEPR